MWLGGVFTKSLYTSLQLPCFPLDYFCSIKYEFPIVCNQPFIANPSMHHFCSHTQSISFAHVTIETLARMLSTFRETSGKHLSCPQEQLESIHWSWVSPPSSVSCQQQTAEKGPHSCPLPPPKTTVTLVTGKQGHTGSGTASISPGK